MEAGVSGQGPVREGLEHRHHVVDGDLGNERQEGLEVLGGGPRRGTVGEQLFAVQTPPVRGAASLPHPPDACRSGLGCLIPVVTAIRVGLYDHPAFRDHDAGAGHPERPARLDAVRRGILEAGLEPRLHLLAPRAATRSLAHMTWAFARPRISGSFRISWTP